MQLSIILPYYLNPLMLSRQLQVWKYEWPANLKRRCEIIIVDDGSPQHPAVEVLRICDSVDLPISVYRVLEDRPWHQHGARNLGAKVAQAPWLLMTDMDHVIPAETLATVLKLSAQGGPFVYTFARRDAPQGSWSSAKWRGMAQTLNYRGVLKPHVNSFALSRELYWKIGGYDEDWCGVYGTDRLFRDRMEKIGVMMHLAGHPLIRVSRDVVPDASTTTLLRKEGRAPGDKKRIALEKVLRGDSGKINVLQFEWERAL